MRSSRISLLELARVAVVSGVLAMAATMLAPATAGACPNKEGAAACACGAGAACPMMQGSCGQAGGCAGAAAEQPSCACPVGQGGSCACGAECPSKSGGACPHGAVEKKPAGCGCGGQGASAAPQREVAPSAAAQRAYVDPQTGELTNPPAGAAAEAAPAAAAAVAPAAEAKQLAIPGAGVMAAFPADRASHAVARVDEDGTPHTGCDHGAE